MAAKLHLKQVKLLNCQSLRSTSLYTLYMYY